MFKGPQTAVKAYDLVLVWDKTANVYRLDRIASAFSLKYERSKTTLSAQSQDVWERSTVPAKKRNVADDISTPRSAAAGARGNVKRLDSSVGHDLGSHSAGSSTAPPSIKSSGELKLRSRTSTVQAPVRRSSRRSLAVEMEEFEDRRESPSESSSATPANRPKRSSLSKESEIRSKGDNKRVKLPDSGIERGSTDEPAGGLRRSRRRSSQAQAEEEASQSTVREPDPAPEADAVEGMEGDDDDLALELERELERELEVDMQDVVAPEEQAPSGAAPSHNIATSTSNRSLSPISRLKLGERQMKISTPKAHSPDLDDTSAYPSPTKTNSLKRSISPLTDRSDAGNGGTKSTSASIGLGLHQTGVGITPTASPQFGIASPIESSRSPLALEQNAAPDVDSDDVDSDDAEDGEEEDDDLQDFAAELDMSLAEVPDPVPASAPAVVEKRRSSRAHTASQSVPGARSRQVRKAYGLGGPRQEEEELEDSD